MKYLDDIKEDSDLNKLWIRLLGENQIKMVKQGKYDDILRMRGYKIFEKQKMEFEKNIIRNENIACIDISFKSFDNFYKKIARYVQQRAEEMLKHEKIINEKTLFSIVFQITHVFEWTCMRCLIQEMHQLDCQGMLCGRNPLEKYQDYNCRYLDSSDFLSRFFKKYNVLRLIIISKTDRHLKNVQELICHLKKDKKIIVSQLCNEKNFNRITELSICLSDEHLEGKTVCRVKLDNGMCLYYKPHNLEGAIYYEQVSKKIFRYCKMESGNHFILNRTTYGWEKEVLQEVCLSQKDVKKYYAALGIHVFLAYILGMTDLHGDNIIASGKCPIVIDTEVVADPTLYVANDNSLWEELYKDTVLNSGLLPGRTWMGQSIDVSGIGSGKNQRVKFAIPTIINLNTSEMKISYKHPTMKTKSNCPIMKGKAIGYESYVEEIIDGFRNAYNMAMYHMEEFKKICLKNIPTRSRFVFRNTQEYLMYVNSMNFPMFMTNSEARQLMLLHMNGRLSCDKKWHDEILKYEMDCIFREVIPIYYVEGKTLFAGNGHQFTNYFNESRKTQIEERINKMSEWDRDFQIRIMQTVFLNKAKKNKNWNGRFQRCTFQINRLNPEKIGEILIKRVHKMGDVYEWDGISYTSSGYMKLNPVDIYFYHGLGGIAVYFAALNKNRKKITYEAILGKIIVHLFHHTNCDVLRNKNMGLFTGECSLIFTYLVLNQIIKDSRLIDYAEKQGEKIIPLLENMAGNDLLNGKAGGIIAMLELYKVTEKKKYLNVAICISEKLIKEAVRMENGIAWADEKNEFLVGMAHGNSGIALAFAWLYYFTKDIKYRQMVTEAIAYEDALYSEKLCNWLDLRSDSKAETIGWCHGAPGIILARLKIMYLTGLGEEIFSLNKRYKYTEVVSQIINKILDANKNDMCLCHGNAGISWILQDIVKDYALFEKIDYKPTGFVSIENILNPGFMMGLSGIGYWMLREEDTELPNILLYI